MKRIKFKYSAGAERQMLEVAAAVGPKSINVYEP